MSGLLNLYDKLGISPSASDSDISRALNKAKRRMSSDDYDIACMILLNRESRDAYNRKIQQIEIDDRNYEQESQKQLALKIKRREALRTENSKLACAFSYTLFASGLLVLVTESFYHMFGDASILTKYAALIFEFLFVANIIVGIYYMNKECSFLPKIGLPVHFVLVFAVFPPFYLYERSKVTKSLFYIVPLSLIGYCLVVFNIITSVMSMSVAY